VTSSSSVSAVAILAAGQGTRMRSPLPKVLHPLCGRPMLDWVLDQARSLAPGRTLLVLGDRAEQVREGLGAAAGEGLALETVIQQPQRGTGHALQCCGAALEGLTGSVVVLYGDMPALRPETLAELVAARPAQGASLLVAHLDHPTGYGRILRDPRHPERVLGIVEERDASPAQRALREVNVGVYALPAEQLPALLARLSDRNAQGELYLTDVVALLAQEGREVRAVAVTDPREARGVNTLAQLGEARAILQERILERHLAAGVLIEDPATTYIDHGVEIGAGTHVLPCTVIRRGVVIGPGCEVGPFSHLRAGTRLEAGAEVGNFTETKQAHLGPKVKAKHLSYLGDVAIGAGSNIGAGTIVANYDGVHKHRTVIGERAFVGSGSVLIAPSAIGDGATTGGGAVVTARSQVPPGAVWVGVPARPLRSQPPRTPGEPDPATGGDPADRS
jgi:bifunctional UDP-N-acetylglucosamine pyrophosphorylase/glucosamine-1-phosphate N-acetyltransferase